MDNYLLSRDRAQDHFLRFDQEDIIRAWDLKSDEESLYVTFLGRPYRVCRRTGRVTRLWDGAQAGYEEVLSIFDLLCHEGSDKTLAGEFAPVNSLRGRPRTVGVGTDFHAGAAADFDRDPASFREACLALGGEAVPMGDMGFRFPVFQDMTVILKFYHGDAEFPPSLTLLWDANTLRYMYYETVFYVAGVLLESIGEKMNKP